MWMQKVIFNRTVSSYALLSRRPKDAHGDGIGAVREIKLDIAWLGKIDE